MCITPHAVKLLACSVSRTRATVTMEGKRADGAAAAELASPYPRSEGSQRDDSEEDDEDD